MDGGRILFGKRSNQRFIAGAKACAAAEQLEREGHFGPAFALYSQAREFFTDCIDSPTIARMASGEERCRAAAVQRGEDSSLALNRDCPTNYLGRLQWVTEYYQLQVEHVANVLARLDDQKKWDEIQESVAMASHLTRCLPGDLRLECLLLFFSARSYLNRGRPDEALPLLRQAYDIRSMSEMNLLPLAMHNIAFNLGTLLFQTGQDATQALEVCYRGLQPCVQDLYAKWSLSKKANGEAPDLCNQLQEVSERIMEVAVMLAECYKRRESFRHLDFLIRSTEDVPSWAYPPHLRENILRCQEHLTESLRVKDLLDQGTAAYTGGDHAAAQQMFERAARLVEPLNLPAARMEANTLLERASLHDPAKLGEHLAHLGVLLEKGLLEQAGIFAEALLKSQPCHRPQMWRKLSTQIAQVKKTSAEKKLPLISEALDAGDVARALELLKQARLLCPQMPGLEPLGARVEKANRIATDWIRVEERIKAALAAGNFSDAEKLVAQAAARAGKTGHEDFLERARCCLEAPRQLREAREAVSEGNYDKAERLLRGIAMLSEIPHLQREAAQMTDTLRTTFLRENT